MISFILIIISNLWLGDIVENVADGISDRVKNSGTRQNSNNNTNRASSCRNTDTGSHNSSSRNTDTGSSNSSSRNTGTSSNNSSSANNNYDKNNRDNNNNNNNNYNSKSGASKYFRFCILWNYTLLSQIFSYRSC